ncbi:Methyltransferase, TIGR04325 family [Gammaproteobacteria bacterium]
MHSKAGRKRIIRRWLPQGLRDLFNYWAGYAIFYRGEYVDWASAQAAAGGYDDDALLRRFTEAALAVKLGNAAWERDGVIWDHIPANMPLFAALGRVALAQGGRLSVLDFGGALGSSYIQCRNFFTEAVELTWSVVEQPKLVTVGQQRIAHDNLYFYSTISQVIAAQRPNVALLSSVLQYLEQPWEVLDQIIAAGIPYLVIDRHPCSVTHELITIQVIPSSLYPASYPSWLFDCPRMLAILAQQYRLLATWEGKDPQIRGWGKAAEFNGYFLQRKVYAY